MIRKFLLTLFVTFGLFSVAISAIGGSPGQYAKLEGFADQRHFYSAKRCGAHWDYNGQQYQYHYIKC